MNMKDYASRKLAGLNIAAILVVISSILATYQLRVYLARDTQILPNLLLGLCFLVTVVCRRSSKINQDLIFKPTRVLKSHEYYRFISAGLAHLNLTHLLLNGFALYNFGPYLLDFFVGQYGFNGPPVFVAFFFIAVILADIPDLILHRKNSQYASVGASGGIAAIISAAAVAFPGMQITFGFGAGGSQGSEGGIPGVIYVIGYFVISLILSFRKNSTIGHLAHAAGTAVGVVIILIMGTTQGLNLFQAMTSSYEGGITSPAVAQSSLFNRLSAASGSYWTHESMSGLAKNKWISLQYKDNCAVWELSNESQAKAELNAVLSDATYNGKSWYSTDIDGYSGVVLFAQTKNSVCAYDALHALHWGSLQ